MSRRNGERRRDRYGELRELARAEGYVMFRRPGAKAYCMSVEEWESLPLANAGGVIVELRAATVHGLD